MTSDWMATDWAATEVPWMGAGVLAAFALIWVRLAVVLLTAPLLGRAVGIKVRLATAAMLAAVIAPLHASLAGVPIGDLSASATWAADFPLWVMREAMLGLTLGGALLMLLTAARLAGHWIAQAAGWSESWGAAEDDTTPNGVARLMDFTAAAVFLTAGGHRLVLGGLLDSFRASPPGQGADATAMAAELCAMAALSFDVALRSAAPVLLAILSSQAALGVASRAAPAWNTLSLGLGIQTLLVLLAILLSLHATAWISWDPLPEVVGSWGSLLSKGP